MVRLQPNKQTYIHIQKLLIKSSHQVIFRWGRARPPGPANEVAAGHARPGGATLPPALDRLDGSPATAVAPPRTYRLPTRCIETGLPTSGTEIV